MATKRTRTSTATATARDSRGRFVSKSTAAAAAEANDGYSNQPARLGLGTSNLVGGSEYPLTRFSNNYQTLLSLYREHWIARRIVEVPAQDMVKAWPTITSELSADDLKQFDRTLARTGTRKAILTTLKWARLFGGAGALIVIDGQEDMLDEPLHRDSIEIGSFKGLIPFDRWSGLSPTMGVCSDVNQPLQFGLPEGYQVHGPSTSTSFKVHASRILRFTGPDIPSPEFQAQSYWGISCLEPVFEELNKIDSASWSIINLLFRAQILSEVNPDLANLLAGAGTSQEMLKKYHQRMAEKNHLLSNQGLNILGEGGSLQSSTYSFGGVSDVLQQFQLFVSGAAQIPVSILYGRTISGLGQSNDADLQIYEDRIAQWQNADLRPVLEQQLYPVICMSEFGEVPDDLDLDFPSIRSMTGKDKVELMKTGSDAIFAGFDRGVYGRKSTLIGLKRLGDPIGEYTWITQDQIDAADDDVQQQGDVPPLESMNEEDKPSAELEAAA
jgi:phage-related protein (TIGR01555 family)